MTKSQQVLIDLLKKSLFNAVIEVPKDTNWQEVYDEANLQSVIPMAFDGTEKIADIPKDIYKKFKNHTIAVMLNNDNIVKEQNELLSLLEKNNIKYAILKGASVARYYPKPELRTLGDVDFLVSREEFDSTKQLLVENGYILVEDELDHFHCTFTKNAVVFELHFEMSDFPQTQIGEDLRKTLKAATNHTKNATYLNSTFKALDTLYQANSLLLHTERHLIADGIGLRQLLDFGFFSIQNPDFLTDEKNIDFLKEFGLYKLATVCNDLFRKYFCDESVENNTVDMLFEMALRKGNFGAKREKEETYSNFDLEKENGNFVLKYFNYFKKRAKMTWPLARKYPWLQNLGIVYLPIRHIFRVFLKTTERIDYKKVISYNNEIDLLYNELNVFRR